MASILEMLLSTMTDDEKSIMRKKLAENPQILVEDATAGNLLSIYKAEAEADPANAVTVTEPVVVPTVPVTPSAAAAAAATADASASILSKLTSIETSLSGQLADLKKNTVSKADLPAYREELLTLTLSIGDEISALRDRNRTELGKPLDMAAFKTFADSAKTADGRPGYPSLTKAWESYTLEERNKKAIDTGIAEGVKARTSAATVPGQTQSSALSPSLQMLAKARESARPGDRSSAMAAADKLAALVRAREEGSAQ